MRSKAKPCFCFACECGKSVEMLLTQCLHQKNSKKQIKKQKIVLTKVEKCSIRILVPRKRDTDNGNLIERGNERKAQN